MFYTNQKFIRKIKPYFSGDTSNVSRKIKLRPFNFHTGKNLEISLGKNCKIHDYVIINGGSELRIGDNSFIGPFSVIGVNESVVIGDNVMIADAVSIRDTDHSFSEPSILINKQGITTTPVTIKDNVWIGYGAVITKGVTIGEGAVVGANSVVTKNVSPGAVVVGVPAKEIKNRYK